MKGVPQHALIHAGVHAGVPESFFELWCPCAAQKHIVVYLAYCVAAIVCFVIIILQVGFRM